MPARKPGSLRSSAAPAEHPIGAIDTGIASQHGPGPHAQTGRCRLRPTGQRGFSMCTPSCSPRCCCPPGGPPTASGAGSVSWLGSGVRGVAAGGGPVLSGAELARDAMLTPQSVNAIVVHLERAGLLERRPDGRDHRLRRIYVSQAGRQAPCQRRTCGEGVGHAYDSGTRLRPVLPRNRSFVRCVTGTLTGG
jgi:hypothetical protein